MLAGCGSMGVVPKASDSEFGAASAESTPDLDWKADGNPVVVAPEVIEAWEFLYRFITETEFVLCLEGSRQQGVLVVDGFKLARISYQAYNRPDQVNALVEAFKTLI